MLALIVNPIAGVGGPAGLAGSDGAEVQETARRLGGIERAGERATAALAVLASARPGARVLTLGGDMGENAVRAAGLEPIVVATPPTPSVADDTANGARVLVDAGAELVLFAGGDGTSRDVARGIGQDAAALGIPAGVKMYSPVFAVSPRAAGAVAVSWLAEGGLPTSTSEVLDIEEEQLRHARVEPRLFAMMEVPHRAGRTQARKTSTPADERAAVRLAARGAASRMRGGIRYLLGPGGTMSALAGELGIEKTPLGVDVVLDGRVVCAGASETQLLDEIRRGPARAVVSIIGGQGFLLGRGNQQLSSRVIAALGDDPLMVVAPEQKLIDLAGRALLVDTGDPAVDTTLVGHTRVVTAPGSLSYYPVVAPEHAAAPASTT